MTIVTTHFSQPSATPLRTYSPPLVSLIVTTRDRPAFLPIVLACCRDQTVTCTEIIIVDDGDNAPVDPQLAASLGARVIRAEPGTPIGTKLNLGIVAARGE